MEPVLWTEKHQPSLAELPQSDLRQYLSRAQSGPINLLLHGPAGSGKTAAVIALAETLHDDPSNDLLTINVADFFGLTKKELADDPRFEGFLSAKQVRESSKAALMNHVLRETASYRPVSGSYKTVLLDNAEAMREDFQQALRRIMERHHEATQFILTTRQASGVLPALRSRCLPIPVRSPTDAEVVTVLEAIAAREDVPADPDGLAYLAGYADGNLRRAILAAQTTAEDAGELTMEAAYETLGSIRPDDRIESMLDAAESGDFSSARSTLDDLLVDAGYSGEEILELLLDVARSRYDVERVMAIQEAAGTIEFDMQSGNSDRIHLSHLLTRFHTIDFHDASTSIPGPTPRR